MKNERSVSQLRLDNKITHHWLIETPNGPTSKGECLIHPGEIKHFPTAFADTVKSDSDPLRKKGGYSTPHLT